MHKRNIIVIGASAGGFETLKQLVAGLPADLKAAVFIVWHIPPDITGVLPQVLNRAQKLPAANARNLEPITEGRIYIAPPDKHLILEKNAVRVTRGPKENGFRPAVDPLFRSAAFHFGPRVIGIVLSGALDDGTAGLYTIKNYGGTAIVQQPSEAQVDSMPLNAIRAVEVDHIVPVAEMPALLMKLTTEEVAGTTVHDPEDHERIGKVIRVAIEDKALEEQIMQFGELTPYTCPKCHGVLSAIKEGKRIRYRCHTGHAFSADALLVIITKDIENSLWNSIRAVEESVILLNHMGDHFAELNQTRLAAKYFRKAKDAMDRCNQMRQVVFDHEQVSADHLEEEAETNDLNEAV